MPAPQTIDNSILNVLTGNVASLAKPAALYCALFSVAPTKTTPGTEFTAAVAYSYARQAVTFSAASSGQTSNPAPIGFPALNTLLSSAPSPWPPAVALGIFDALTGGTLWYYQNIPSKPVLTNGYNMNFATASIVLTHG